MEDIMKDAQTFTGKELRIEEVLPSSKRIDVIITDPEKWIEYKWYATNETVTRQKFLEEFVERDLKYVPGIDNLEWRIKGAKLSKDKVKAYLSSSEGRIALKKIPAARANSLLGRTDLTDFNKEAIADAFIDYFDLDINYVKIFK
jgi:hypothetical protein